jgi:hypothetical protein
MFLLTLAAGAQSISISVISCAGSYLEKGNLSFSSTVGEMSMVQTFTDGRKVILTQGFQQPTDRNLIKTDVTTPSESEFGSVSVYPVPAVDNVTYGFTFPDNGRVSVVLYNGLGQKMSDVFSSNYEGGKVVNSLNVSDYAAGIYYLSINFTDNNGKTHVMSRKFQVTI